MVPPDDTTATRFTTTIGAIHTRFFVEGHRRLWDIDCRPCMRNVPKRMLVVRKDLGICPDAAATKQADRWKDGNTKNTIFATPSVTRYEAKL
jgi:hypothetical protein